MGTYGSMLSHFPELFRTVSFWRRDPQLGSGYNKGEEIKVRVVILADAQAKFQEKRATDYRALDFENHDVMYSRSSAPIEKGMFLRHPDDGEIYTVDEPFDYSFTGGFRMWGIDRVQGANSESPSDSSLKVGIF